MAPTPSAVQTPTPAPTAAPAADPVTSNVSSSPLPPTATVVTVTVTGDEDPAALRSFLRIILASFAPSSSVVTATVGALPDDLGIGLTVPSTATVIGGVVRTDAFGGNQLFLATEGAAEDLVTALREQLLGLGFVAPAENAMGSAGQVFLSTEFSMPLMLCSSDGETVVNLGQLSVAGEQEAVSLSSFPNRGFGAPCAEDPFASGSGFPDVLPQLAPPPQAQVTSTGSGSGSDANSYTLSAEAEITSVLTPTQIAEFYELQLEGAGWERLEESRTDAVAWSAWSFVDDNGNAWTGTFSIIRQAGEESGYLASLRAESQG
ncbi:MAG: hypothetical protein HC802_15795 [Caldilineaceae bacterium]|nr:hypothetical protein [Caldilineaceae bacterium]